MCTSVGEECTVTKTMAWGVFPGMFSEFHLISVSAGFNALLTTNTAQPASTPLVYGDVKFNVGNMWVWFCPCHINRALHARPNWDIGISLKKGGYWKLKWGYGILFDRQRIAGYWIVWNWDTGISDFPIHGQIVVISQKKICGSAAHSFSQHTFCWCTYFALYTCPLFAIHCSTTQFDVTSSMHFL